MARFLPRRLTAPLFVEQINKFYEKAGTLPTVKKMSKPKLTVLQWGFHHVTVKIPGRADFF
jgi:hypothetical protein